MHKVLCLFCTGTAAKDLHQINFATREKAVNITHNTDAHRALPLRKAHQQVAAVFAQG
nr:hypothetical protein [Xanthomonas arboricola]